MIGKSWMTIVASMVMLAALGCGSPDSGSSNGGSGGTSSSQAPGPAAPGADAATTAAQQLAIELLQGD